jgi:hypothetical protein
MVRSAIGGVVAGLIMFFIGFVFWGTPLSGVAFNKANDAEAAAVQLAMAQNLTRSGTGTYLIPTPDTQAGTVAYGRGPIATVHFNSGGFAANDLSMMLPGLIFALVSGLLMSFGIGAVSRENDFARIARLVILSSLGFTIWTILAQPVFNNYGWTYWIYFFVSEAIAFIVAGLVIARWFVPRATRAAAATAPTSVESSSDEARSHSE